jgi:hypothetical protein
MDGRVAHPKKEGGAARQDEGREEADSEMNEPQSSRIRPRSKGKHPVVKAIRGSARGEAIFDTDEELTGARAKEAMTAIEEARENRERKE